MREAVGSSYTRQYETRQAGRAAQNIPPASPARAGHFAGLHPEDMPDEDEVADDLTVVAPEEDEGWYPKMPKSALRLRETRDDPRVANQRVSRQGPRTLLVTKQHRIPARASALREQQTEARLRLRLRLLPLVFVGLALLVMVGGYMLFTLVANWWTTTQQQWQYGYPRTYQCDAVVGHNHDSSASPTHFIALNLNGRVEVIEFPAGDASEAKIYVGPSLIGTNPNLAPVTLSFADVNGDGKLDLIMHVPGGQFVFVNTGTAFRPATSADQVTLPKS